MYVFQDDKVPAFPPMVQVRNDVFLCSIVLRRHARYVVVLSWLKIERLRTMVQQLRTRLKAQPETQPKTQSKRQAIVDNLGTGHLLANGVPLLLNPDKGRDLSPAPPVAAGHAETDASVLARKGGGGV